MNILVSYGGSFAMSAIFLVHFGHLRSIVAKNGGL